ncbi:MAG: hypothetical protein KAS12_00410, partial [Candidatus Aenigmarchaeota archaeon]|nr:hypothetical protein [Candidatus Aenigmarchaeota archaeon]
MTDNIIQDYINGSFTGYIDSITIINKYKNLWSTARKYTAENYNFKLSVDTPHFENLSTPLFDNEVELYKTALDIMDETNKITVPSGDEEKQQRKNELIYRLEEFGFEKNSKTNKIEQIPITPIFQSINTYLNETLELLRQDNKDLAVNHINNITKFIPGMDKALRESKLNPIEHQELQNFRKNLDILKGYLSVKPEHMNKVDKYI